MYSFHCPLCQEKPVMDHVNNLLDTVRKSCAIPSDNMLSKKIGVTRALISGWRVGRYPVPDARIAELCAMANLDGGEWMAKIHAEAAASPAERALWRSVLDRLSAAAAVVALVVLAVQTGAHEGLVTALSPLALTAPSIHYAKWRIGRHDREFVWSGFGSSLACQITPLAKRNSQH
ncbi:DUF3693 domain-containing protein [Xanthomonas campestris]|uniref:DUF3693 domain-containing protein n=1 Tax=Xanthomonas campestris TaxID=339 RepID=UPI00388E9469